MNIWWKSFLGEMTMAFMEAAHPEEQISEAVFFAPQWGNSNEFHWFSRSVYADAGWGCFMVSSKYSHFMFQLDDAGVPRQRCCQECRSFYDDSEYGDYGVLYSYHPMCERFPHYDNLKTFPFRNAPKRCFVPKFWCTKHALLWEWDGPGHDLAWTAYNKEFPKRSQEETKA